MKYPGCPHCGGLLYKDNDDYEDYLTCFGCARSFNFDMKPRRIATLVYDCNTQSVVTHMGNSGNMRME